MGKPKADGKVSDDSTTRSHEIAGVLEQAGALLAQAARLLHDPAPKLAAPADAPEPCGGCCLDCTTGTPPGTILNCAGEDDCQKVIPPDYFAVLVRDPNRPGQQAYYERPANFPAAELRDVVAQIATDPAAVGFLVGAVIGNPALLAMLAQAIAPLLPPPPGPPVSPLVPGARPR